MTRLIHAELLKLGTVRSFWAYIIVGLAFVPVTIAQTILDPADSSVAPRSRLRFLAGLLVLRTRQRAAGGDGYRGT